MTPNSETVVSAKDAMPRGYIFLRKGNPYKTLHCRRLTHAAGKHVYVVEERKKTVGIRVPKSIYYQVQALAQETYAARRAATEQRDLAAVRHAAIEIEKQFPKMPKHDKEKILRHGFRKHSGRVGRTGLLTLSKKVLFAVTAHIRHSHTDYDRLLKRGMDRHKARNTISKETDKILREWRNEVATH